MTYDLQLVGGQYKHTHKYHFSVLFPVLYHIDHHQFIEIVSQCVLAVNSKEKIHPRD